MKDWIYFDNPPAIGCRRTMTYGETAFIRRMVTQFKVQPAVIVDILNEGVLDLILLKEAA